MYCDQKTDDIRTTVDQFLKDFLDAKSKVAQLDETSEKIKDNQKNEEAQLDVLKKDLEELKEKVAKGGCCEIM